METAKIILQAWEEFRSLSPEEKKLRKEQLEKRMKEDLEEEDEENAIRQLADKMQNAKIQLLLNI